MTTYYVGPGGNDANSGLNWAARKLTLNGAEDVPVVAGDAIYVAPGVYREMLTCDVSGGAGAPITYIGDVSGEHTDGVGGVVRVTGSDNDQTATRANCIVQDVKRNYRAFRGFAFDTTTGDIIHAHLAGSATGDYWTIEDCSFQNWGATTAAIYCYGSVQTGWIVRRCCFIKASNYGACIWFRYFVGVDNTGHLVENCIMVGSSDTTSGIYCDFVGGITIRNCVILACAFGIRTANLTAGQTITVNNCIINACTTALSAGALGQITENYNAIAGNTTPRTNVAVGANSNTYPALYDLGLLHSGASQVSGFRFPPPLFGALSQWSQLRAIADTGPATEDIFGLPRPVTAGKRSWGAVQYVPMIRDTTNPRTGIACKELEDAGREQIRVPTVAISMVFSVWVYRGANYAGVNPQMIIKQPGQADVTVTDAGVAGVYNLLTTTLTPAALPGYVVIELVSNNTAAAGAYGVYFDDLTALEA